MSDRTPMDRYLDRVLRCLEAEEKADKERRRYWRSRGGAEAEAKTWYEATSVSRKKGVARLTLPRTSLNIKPEVNYIAFLHDVVFALQSQ